jgi:hydrogenase nickel incorporation protein HypA/HybF
MHEMAITQSIIDIALAEAQKVSARKITRINVIVGALSGAAIESIQFYFEYMAKGNAAEGAELDCKAVPASLKCGTCKNEFKPVGSAWICPQCQGVGLEISAGKDCYVESIEVE